MIIRTRNSDYLIKEVGPGEFTVEKVRDAVEGGHRNVRVGDRCRVSSLSGTRPGQHLQFHVIRWEVGPYNPTRSDEDVDWTTSVVVEVEP